MKRIHFLLTILVFFILSCSSDRYVLRVDSARLKPGSMTVLCYSNEDKLTVEMTRLISAKLKARGFNVLQLDEMQKMYPVYPKKFFLDLPNFIKNKKTDRFYLPENNMKIVADAQKVFKTDYVMVIIFECNFKDNLFTSMKTKITTSSFLNKYPEGKTVWFMHDIFIKSRWATVPYSRSKWMKYAMDAVPGAADQYVNAFAEESKNLFLKP